MRLPGLRRWRALAPRPRGARQARRSAPMSVTPRVTPGVAPGVALGVALGALVLAALALAHGRVQMCAAAFKAEETGGAISRESVYLKHATPSQNDTAPRSGRCGRDPAQDFPASLFRHECFPALRAYFCCIAGIIFLVFLSLVANPGNGRQSQVCFATLSTWKEAKASAGTIKRDTTPALNRDPAVPVSEARPFSTRRRFLQDDGASRRCVAAKGGGPERKGREIWFGSALDKRLSEYCPLDRRTCDR